MRKTGNTNCFVNIFYMNRMWTSTVAALVSNSSDSRSMHPAALPSFAEEIMEVEVSATFSTYRSSPPGRVWPKGIHWTKGVGSPENSPGKVRVCPTSALSAFCEPAAIRGGSVNKETCQWDHKKSYTAKHSGYTAMEFKWLLIDCHNEETNSLIIILIIIWKGIMNNNKINVAMWCIVPELAWTQFTSAVS